MYVWVLPGGRNELAKLTLIILDYALTDFPSPNLQEVTRFLDKSGEPTTSGNAAQIIKAFVPYQPPTECSTKGPELFSPAESQGLYYLPQGATTPPTGGALEFEQLRRALVPFSR